MLNGVAKSPQSLTQRNEDTAYESSRRFFASLCMCIHTTRSIADSILCHSITILVQDKHNALRIEFISGQFFVILVLRHVKLYAMAGDMLTLTESTLHALSVSLYNNGRDVQYLRLAWVWLATIYPSVPTQDMITIWTDRNLDLQRTSVLKSYHL